MTTSPTLLAMCRSHSRLEISRLSAPGEWQVQFHTEKKSPLYRNRKLETADFLLREKIALNLSGARGDLSAAR